MVKTSIIIPTTTGGFHHLIKLLPNLSEEKESEIIIIDNASKDGTTGYLGNYDVLVKNNKIKMNFSESNNYGATKASGEYLLFLNNDTIITPGFTQEMIKTFDVGLNIAVVGCLIFTMESPRKVQHAGVCFTQDWIPYELGLPVPEISKGITVGDARVQGTRPVPSVTAACMMVKKDVFNEVGGFDEDFVFGWEDTDLVLRIREKGYNVWYTGNTYIRHFHFGGKAVGRFKHEKENRELYEEKWVKTKKVQKVLKGFREG